MLCFLPTHTHTRAGREEQGQPAHTKKNRKTGRTNKDRKQAGEHTTSRQNKGKGKGEGRGGNPGQKRKAEQATKQNHSQRDNEAGQQREGTNTLLGEGGERGLGGWEGGKLLRALHPWTRLEKRYPVPQLYFFFPGHTGERGENLYFSLVGTSPIWLLRHMGCQHCRIEQGMPTLTVRTSLHSKSNGFKMLATS